MCENNGFLIKIQKSKNKPYVCLREIQPIFHVLRLVLFSFGIKFQNIFFSFLFWGKDVVHYNIYMSFAGKNRLVGGAKYFIH